MSGPRWELFRGSGGGEVVRKEINSYFENDKRGRAQLGELMRRVQEGQTLGREVESIGDGVLEAKFTYSGQEFRLFFSRQEQGLLFLALHLINKKSRRARGAIKLAQRRLSEWRRR